MCNYLFTPDTICNVTFFVIQKLVNCVPPWSLVFLLIFDQAESVYLSNMYSLFDNLSNQSKERYSTEGKRFGSQHTLPDDLDMGKAF